jgi:hypothetical protein
MSLYSQQYLNTQKLVGEDKTEKKLEWLIVFINRTKIEDRKSLAYIWSVS